MYRNFCEMCVLFSVYIPHLMFYLALSSFLWCSFPSLQRSGVAKKWAADGKEWVFFFQDTNPLVVHALVPMLGVSVDRHYDMNSLCVPRRAGEAAGAITRLVGERRLDLT
jgi:UDP-N-acetylglucosamine pyrophosphorylase